MTSLIAIIILVACFGLMAIGLIFAKKVLKRGCSLETTVLAKESKLLPLNDSVGKPSRCHCEEA